MKSIGEIDSDSDTLLGDLRVLDGIGIVVLGVSSAVAVIPGVGGVLVPELDLSSRVLAVAGTEVGADGALAEVNDEEVNSRYHFLKGGAFVVAVVPGDVGIGDAGRGSCFVGSVPVLVVLTDAVAGRQGHQQYQEQCFHRFNKYILFPKIWQIHHYFLSSINSNLPVLFL
jgi:hypothetical protein